MAHDSAPRPKVASARQQAQRPRARHRVTALAVFAAVALLGAFTLGATPAGAAPQPAGTGWVRLGHFAPAEAPVDLSVDGEVRARSVAFRDVSDYLSVSPGSHTFEVRTTGAAEGGEPLLKVRAGVPADGAVTVAAVATRSGLGGQVYDDALATPPAGSALVRFIHASPAVASVDISAVDGPALATGVAYPEASEYRAVPAGTYDLNIEPTTGGDAVAKVAGWTATAGTQATIVIVQGTDGQPDVVPINDSAGTAATPAGGQATGFGGLAPPAPTSQGGVPALWWVLAGTVTLLALGAILSLRSRRPALRSAAILAVTGAMGLGTAACGQARSQASTTTEGSPLSRRSDASGDGDPATTVAATSSTTVPADTPADTEVPIRSGSNVNTDATVGDPVSVSIPSIGVTSTLVPLGLADDGTAEVPEDPQRAGWFTGGPKPGDAGPAVITGHVDTKSGPAVFARLDELAPGDVVEVTTTSSTVRFEANRTEQVPKDAFPTERVYGPAPGDQLRLVTCGGSFDRSIGHYRDNVVVYLTEVS